VVFVTFCAVAFPGESFVTQELRPAKVAEVIELSEKIGFWNSTQILLLIRVNA
jgi:hypothetical protein